MNISCVKAAIPGECKVERNGGQGGSDALRQRAYFMSPGGLCLEECDAKKGRGEKRCSKHTGVKTVWIYLRKLLEVSR